MAKNRPFCAYLLYAFANCFLLVPVVNEGVMSIFEELISMKNYDGATHGACGNNLIGMFNVAANTSAAFGVAIE